MDRINTKHFQSTVILLVTALIHPQVFADQYHYNNILIGDRSAGLGGAYTAVSDDPAGLYYNPAGIVHAIGSNVSGSMSALHKTSTTYENALGGTFDWKRNSSVLLPNYFGVFQSLGKGKIGFSYAVTDSILEDQDQTFKNIPGTSVSTYIINYNHQNTTYKIGPSYAFSINDKLSAGATLYGHLRSQELINNQITYISNDTYYEWKNRYLYSEETGINPVLGLMWEPLDKFSVGLSLRKTFIIDSASQTQSTCKGAETVIYSSVNFCQSNELSRSDDKNSAKREYPLEITTGIAWFPNDRLLIGGDLSYYSATDEALTYAKTAVVNFSVGVEYYLNSDWALRTGIYSNFANTPDLSTSGVSGVQPEHVDMFGLSFSMSHFSRNSALSFGISTMRGNGKAQLFNPLDNGDAALQDVKTSTFSLFLSANHSY